MLSPAEAEVQPLEGMEQQAQTLLGSPGMNSCVCCIGVLWLPEALSNAKEHSQRAEREFPIIRAGNGALSWS